MEEGLLYIAGEGPEKETIEKMIQQKYLENRVKLLGFLNQTDMTEYIRKCKFVVVPSIWYENCPYSILETLAIGKPVIGANIGGIPELISDNENGFIYSTVLELKEKMVLLFQDKNLVKQFSEKSKEFALNKYSKEIYYEKLYRIYQNLQKGK